MQITHMTLAKAAHAETPVPLELREVDGGINAFLGDHIMGLRHMTSKRKTPPGKFLDSEPQNLFRDLYAGTDEAFLAAADGLTKRLIARMDGRTAKGLLICLRAHDEQEHFGGVLKLQVVAPNAAVLEKLASGDVMLSAVTDLLDKPGELQKGALSTSWLAEERVMVGDQLGQDASYFPKAFGIQIYARPANAVSDLFTVLEQIAPDLSAPIANALSSVSSGELDSVLTSLARKVPDLTPDVQSEITDALERQARPVVHVDTDHSVTETITVGAIKITGPVSQMRQSVHVERQDNSDDRVWTVRVNSRVTPRRSFR